MPAINNNNWRCVHGDRQALFRVFLYVKMYCGHCVTLRAAWATATHGKQRAHMLHTYTSAYTINLLFAA